MNIMDVLNSDAQKLWDPENRSPAQAPAAEQPDVEQPAAEQPTVEQPAQEERERWQHQLREREKELLRREAEVSRQEKELEQKKALFSQQTEADRAKQEAELAKKYNEEMNRLTAWRAEQMEKFRQDLLKQHNEQSEKLRTRQNAELRQEEERQKKELNERIQEERGRLEQSLRPLREEKEMLSRQREEAQKKEEELKKLQETLEQQQEEQKSREEALEQCKKRLTAREKRLADRQEHLDEEARQRMQEILKEEQKKCAQKLNVYWQMIEEKSTRIENLEAKMSAVADLRTALNGQEPSEILKQLEFLRGQNDTLQQELSKRPLPEVQEHCSRLEEENKKYIDQISQLQRTVDDQNVKMVQYRMNESGIASMQAELEFRQKEILALQNQKEELQNALDRLTVSGASASDRDKRIAELSGQGFVREEDILKLPPTQDINELNWLQEIRKNCDMYGITFPERILYAFHTALKIGDWSIMTVLSGVSGTGKSELPRLYAAFGGMYFISVPVQPNWDSQESMLGYFNSIDNRFDAQPLLRFLVQFADPEPESQEDAKPEQKKYSALAKSMGIVLLDEMNLAHAELYFAEFLSKLETRRGHNKNYLPEIEVKLGAGMDPYLLKLSRRILWTGTMNEDETTKSLSDKVLDRSMVIGFPRPKTLKDRSLSGSLDKYLRNLRQQGKLYALPAAVWFSWVQSDIKQTLSEAQNEQIVQYRKITEDINRCLGDVGRAIGHRVWQSIEYYIINYPTVLAAKETANGELTQDLQKAMHVAYEDCLVQKIMPKLRGVEEDSDALDKIEEILRENDFDTLLTDYDRARRKNYGQFIWNSAEYLEQDEEAQPAPDAPQEDGETANPENAEAEQPSPQQ